MAARERDQEKVFSRRATREGYRPGATEATGAGRSYMVCERVTTDEGDADGTAQLPPPHPPDVHPWRAAMPTRSRMIATNRRMESLLPMLAGSLIGSAGARENP